MDALIRSRATLRPKVVRWRQGLGLFFAEGTRKFALPEGINHEVLPRLID
jgi:hypothetical protein